MATANGFLFSATPEPDQATASDKVRKILDTTPSMLDCIS